MTKGTMARVDERGRIIIPAPFRESLSIKEGSNVLMRIDEKSGTIMILPFAVESDKLARIDIMMSDTPGTLSQILKSLASEKIDLIRSESTAQERGRFAEWNAIVDLSRCRKSISQIKRMMLKGRFAREIRMEKL